MSGGLRSATDPAPSNGQELYGGLACCDDPDPRVDGEGYYYCRACGEKLVDAAEDTAIAKIAALFREPRPGHVAWRTKVTEALRELGFAPASEGIPEEDIRTTEDFVHAIGDLIEDARLPGIFGLDDEQGIEEGAKGPRRISLLLSEHEDDEGKETRLDVTIETKRTPRLSVVPEPGPEAGRCR
jgi:hypothetical protein